MDMNGGQHGHPSAAHTSTDGNGARGDDGTQRVQLACFYCRAKRIRCSGTKPVCSACAKTGAECEWPAGRRRKRTRREMEEARRREAEHGDAFDRSPPGASGSSNTGSVVPMRQAPQAQHASDAQPQQQQFDPFSSPWTMQSTSNFVWPANFLPDGSFTFDALGNMDLPQADLTLDPALAGFLTEHSPGTDMRLLNAVESQTAYLSGDPTADDEVELYYYRFSGSTAFHPGINRVSLRLQRRKAGAANTTSSAPEPETSDDEATPASVRSQAPLRRQPAPEELFDASGMPHRHIWDPLFAKFLQHMSQHFPSVSRQRMEERFSSGTMSAFLANCICALGARFSGEGEGDGVAACAPFVAKAQELVIPLLHLPAYDTATGLLCLAWVSYGQNSDSGLWQYSGMAIRMAIDLGVHEVSEIYESAAHVVRTRLLFWTMFITDRVVAFATGRPASIPEDIIEIPLPEDSDFFPDPARNTAGYPPEAIQPVPFVYLVRLMIICGRISNVLNGRRGRARTLVAADEPMADQLAELQARLVSFYAALPDQMRWSADNFKAQHNRGHGGTFLSLHLWANAVLALVYHPDLLKSPSGEETPLNQSMPRNVKLALASSRQIGECMVFADLVSHTSYTASPMVVQPIYVAAMALVHELRATQATERPSADEQQASDLFLVSMARQNLMALLKAIARIEGYWAGAGYVARLLEKRSGLIAPRSKRTFISLPDSGLLRRFQADKNHPHNIAPATETSLRESIARSHSAGPSPVWMSDLFSGYTIENMSFAPADSVDFARLMAAGDGQQGTPQQQQQQQMAGMISGAPQNAPSV